MPTTDHTPWIGVLPGAARGPSKQWPTSHFIEALQKLISTTPCHIALMGTPAEAELCQTIANQLGGSAISLAGKTSLPELVAALGQCKLVICNDSGGMHLATTVGTSVVAIYGITAPDKTGPLGSGHTIIQAQGITSSRDIPRNSQKARAALKSIAPHQVTEAALNILSRYPSQPSSQNQ